MSGWLDRAYCKRDPELWFDGRLTGVAVHNCRSHCPVIRECWQRRESIACVSGVAAGIAYNYGGHVASRQPQPERCQQCLTERGAEQAVQV